MLNHLFSIGLIIIGTAVPLSGILLLPVQIVISRSAQNLQTQEN